MIPAKQLDRAISNIKYRFEKYYLRMGMNGRNFSNPPPSGPLRN